MYSKVQHEIEKDDSGLEEPVSLLWISEPTKSEPARLSRRMSHRRAGPVAYGSSNLPD